MSSSGHGQQRGKASAGWHEWASGTRRPHARDAVCSTRGHEPLRKQANLAPSGAWAEPATKVGGQKVGAWEASAKVGLRGRRIENSAVNACASASSAGSQVYPRAVVQGGSEAWGVLGASLSALLTVWQKEIRVVAAKLTGELFRDACAGAYADEPFARAGFTFGCVRVGPD